MARDTNFTKAVKELLGSEASGTDPETSASEVPFSSGYASSPEAGTESPNSGYSRPSGGGATPPTPPPPPVVPHDWTAASMPPDVTYITRDTIVTGSITSRSHVQMEGQMTGDIASAQDVRITRKVDGNVDGSRIMLNDGAVVGDLSGKSEVTVDSTAVVIGNISADTFDADGRVKGSLKVNNSVALKSNAIIFGNITASSLNVQDGAVIRGNVQVISSRGEEGDPFALGRKGGWELEG